MKKILIIFSLFTTIYSQAQNIDEVINSLKNELKNNPDDKKKATIYSDLTWYYTSISLDSSFTYGSKAIEMSKKVGDSTVLAQVYSDLGAAYFRKGDFLNSEKNYLIAYKVRKLKKDELGLAKININLGSIYASKQKYKPAMKAYLESIAFFEKNKKFDIVNSTKVNVGLIFNDMKNYPKAIKYLTEAIQYEQKNNLDDRLCTSCLNLGNVYLQIKDTTKALKYYEKSLKSCKISDNKNGIGAVYNNLSAIKIAQKEDATALLTKTKDVRSQFNSDLSEQTTKINLVRNLLNQKEFNQAKKVLLEIKSYFIKNNSKENLSLTYYLFIPVCANLNQLDSVNIYLNKFSEVKNQLSEESVIKQTNELETKYQTAKKEKLLIEKDAENKRKNTWILIISLLAVFTSLIGFLIYRQQKLKNKQQEQEFQLKSAIAQIESQNQLQEQRLSISRDLHDNIGAQLTFVISSVDNLKHGNQITDNKITNQLTKISDFTKSTIIELRDTIWAMNNNEFTFEDLRSRIFNFIEKAKSAKEDVDFKFNVDESLQDLKFSSIVGINLYRTIQESINNAVKYADANEILVEVKNVSNKIQIEVQDNGKGFDIENTDFGNGLHNMKKRIEEIDGTFEINSLINKGTKIRFEIPKIDS